MRRGSMPSRAAASHAIDHLSAVRLKTSSMCVREPIASSAVSALQLRTASEEPHRSSTWPTIESISAAGPMVPTRSTASARCSWASSGAECQSRAVTGCSASHHLVAASSSAVPRNT